MSIKQSSGLDEYWLQDRIAAEPAILGLGNLFVRDKERVQNFGRLDLLLEGDDVRYCVECMCGPLDADHLFRAVSYWLHEKDRHPQYQHVAVLVAEDVQASRFYGVVNLLGQVMPIVVIQAIALSLPDQSDTALIFNKAIDTRDQFASVIDDREEGVFKTPDRDYWTSKIGDRMAIADSLFDVLSDAHGSPVEVNYKSAYIGFKVHGRVDNTVLLYGYAKGIKFEIRAYGEEDPGVTEAINQAGLAQFPFNGRYRIKVDQPLEPGPQRDTLVALTRSALR
ncbi:hypothetical protein KUW04_00675 [Halomonas denitrificans]|nr:hypothetical protein [Halomonas denitrificans]